MRLLHPVFSCFLLLLFLGSPAAAFDTFWHAQETQVVGKQFGFSPDAINVMKIGNFSPDLFGPVEDYASRHLDPSARGALQSFGVRNAQTRNAAVFLHFDNLKNQLDRNSQFDLLFNQLLDNTRQTLAEYAARPGIDNTTRKILILETLGASLHTVQDFYSHSDWIHHDFDQMPSSPAGQAEIDEEAHTRAVEKRAPTWFELRTRLGDPDHWPFVVKSGVYPPVAGSAETHTHMNHDNSRLIYREDETPGQPLVSEAKYHEAGPIPAHPGDERSIFRHQQLAVRTATAAGIEWVELIEQNPSAKAAIDSASRWRVSDPKLRRELQGALALELSLSCAAGRWDGENPPAERGALCKVMNHAVTSFAGGTNPLANGPVSQWRSQIEGLVGGVAAAVAFPSALQYTGSLWDVHSRFNILDQLANGFESGTGDYRFNPK